ncbi:MAG TPA: indolepyruvate ferredoxin oxidoreductase family protein [Stellaceae bacterium]|nr:indolepyruvate ferredoxin oxidoreductase family protein [Stellaceae bacterium]
MKSVSLDDKYTLERGPVFLSGVQAIVRLALDQRRRDARAGLATGGFISGYRGSPLGGVDTALWQVQALLKANDIHFEPGLNEELAATAVAGTQQIAAIGRGKFTGVFGIWYGKNPGLDRSGDAIKHGNAVGASAHGGVLAISGDDPGATSSTLPNQCDQAFIAAAIPVLSPANVSEILRFGLIGIALSRYAGTWTGLKTVADTVECTTTITVDPDEPRIVLPNDFALPPQGLSARWPDNRWDQDARLLNLRLPAAKAFARANALDEVVFGARGNSRLAIVTSGKAYGDVREALARLGIDEAVAVALGIIIYKVGMVWPLEPERIRDVLEGLDEVIVVEERRAVLEPQIKDLAYNWSADRRPRIVGKSDEHGAPLLPESGELSPSVVALALGKRLGRFAPPAIVIERLGAIERQHHQVRRAPSQIRVAHFCAGCPHAVSTRVPDGSVAIAGIGCNSLRLWMPDSKTALLPQMGGEGAVWLGMAPFVEAAHVFQNLGDGTYAHSGSLGIRAAVAAGHNITFRLLYNEAAAMTGGQPVEGAFSVPQIARQLLAEGVERIAIASDEKGRHKRLSALGSGVSVHHRDELDTIQRELREWPGVSAIIYDQVCATEKRRRRKRGIVPPPPARAFINTRVCEGCGDCIEQSSCAAIRSVETSFGRKREIDQSACNADLSCLKGFCPSFVTIEGGALRPPTVATAEFNLPLPAAPTLAGRCDMVIEGIGGTGVMTIGAVLGMAAHMSGYGASVLDNTGLARKGGAVSTHVRVYSRLDDGHASRIGDGRATLMLACDLVTAANPVSLAKIEPGRTRVIANADLVPTLQQRLDPDSDLDTNPLRDAITQAAGASQCEFIAATEIAEQALGVSIYANMVMLGFAWQKGLVPLAFNAIEQAITLNGTAVEANRLAFAWGRRAAHDPAAIEQLLRPLSAGADEPSLDALVSRYADELTAYQNAAYAQRYIALVDRVRAAERRVDQRDGPLAFAVARGYFRLLAIKDEYEVARLYSDGTFAHEMQRHFSGAYKIRFHLAPPLLARRDRATGHLRKQQFGAWMGNLFPLLARMKALRGTWLDVFGYTGERRAERRLIGEYQQTIDNLLAALTAQNYELAAEIAALPERIRGFGHVKARTMACAKQCEAELLAGFSDTSLRQRQRESVH